jgi:hypothetical protein
MGKEGGERRCDKYVSGEGIRGELVEGAAPALVDLYTSKGTLRETVTAVRRDTNQMKLCTEAGDIVMLEVPPEILAPAEIGDPDVLTVAC